MTYKATFEICGKAKEKAFPTLADALRFGPPPFGEDRPYRFRVVDDRGRTVAAQTNMNTDWMWCG